MENEVEIVCQGCGVTFVYRQRDDRRGPVAAPTRCSLCRAEQARPSSDATQPKYTGDPNEYRSPMAGDFPAPQPRRPRRNGPRRPYPEGAKAGERANQTDDRPRPHNRRRPMFSAVCAKCGSTAHVPFEPSKFQEVLCRSCFQERKGRPASDPANQ